MSSTASKQIIAVLLALQWPRLAIAASQDDARPANAIGPASAPVTMEFFSDLQCPPCAKYEPIVKSIRAEYGDKVRLMIRQFPLKTHEHAELAAWAAEAAADQHKFGEMAG